MPSQIYLENSRERPCALRHSRLSLFAFFLILFFCFFGVAQDAVAAAPVITSATTASVTVRSAFSYQTTATNAPTSYGATGLPAGLTLNSKTGLISGTPTVAGTSSVTLSATNSSGTGHATLALTIIPTSYFVQAVAHAASGTATLGLYLPNNTVAGDLIMVGFDFNSNATPLSVTDSLGNTFTQVGTQLASPGGARSAVYYAKNIKGGPDTVTVKLSAACTSIKLYLTEYFGMNPTSPIDAQAGATGSAGTVSSGDATTTVASDVIYGYCVGDGTCTAGSGFTARSTIDNNLIEDEIAGNPGAYAATGSATSGWTMQMVALKPASPAITSATTASGVVGSAFSYQITATNVPTSYGATGLPAGLAVNSGTGLISGTPTAAGTYTATLSAKNSYGTGNATLTLTISAAAAITRNAHGVNDVGATSTASPIAVSLSNVAAGDLIVCEISLEESVTFTSVSDPLNGIYSPAITLHTNATITQQVGIYFVANAVAGSYSVSLAWTGGATSYQAIACQSWRGVVTSSPQDTTMTQQQDKSSTANPTAGSAITPAGPGELIIGNLQTSAQVPTAGPNYVLTDNASTTYLWPEYWIQTAATATNAPYTNSSDNWTDQMVAFKPASSGAQTAGATSPVVSLSSTSLTFASQAVGTTSATQTVTLSNTGGSALTISSLALTGTNPSDFAQTNTCGSSVAAGANCSLTVSFKPTASGTRTAAVTLSDNATGSPQTVTLTGTGTAAAASLSPTSVTFANQAVGATSTAQTITLSNTGSSALTISSLTLTGTNPGDFTQTNTCGSSVAAGANCTVSVTFKPAASGTRTAAVTLTDNASGSPQAVSLSGTGTAAAASLSPTSLTFASQAVGATSAAQTITLTNSGNAALTVTSIALAGTNPTDFAQSNNCGSSVAAGANCAISVTFTPAASGSFTAAITLTDNATGSPQTVSLSGTGGSTSAVASLSATSMAFGSEPVDMTSSSQVVTLNNTGSAALTITSIAFTGANASNFSEANTCGSSVAAGGNCTIAILFTPSAAGASVASLTIADNASGSPQSVSLSGTGTHDVILAWTPSTTSGIAGYNVFRGTTSGGESATPVNSSPLTGAAYTDTNVEAGQTYYYMVTAIGSNDTSQSSDSNEASATVPSP